MVLMGDPSEFLDEKKHYMSPWGTVYTGKGWAKVMNRSMYDIFNAEEFKSFIEVVRDKKNKTWKKVEANEK